jgi:DNA-binding NarL/FixJ family response regulator
MQATPTCVRREVRKEAEMTFITGRASIPREKVLRRAPSVVSLDTINPPADFKAHLTPRQIQVLKLLSAGHSTGSVAEQLQLSTEAVRNHVRGILLALGVHSRVQAVVRARELGLS